MKLSRISRPMLAAAVAAIPVSSQAIDIPTIKLDGGIKVLSIQNSTSNSFQFGSYPVTSSIPISGFEPKVVFTLTDKEDPDDFIWTASKSTSIQGNPITTFPTYHYAVATLDSGGQTHLISYSDAGPSGFDLENSNRVGGYVSQLAGASGVEDADISDPLGLYATGLSNVSTGGAVNSAALQGQYNVSVLSAQTGSSLPNIVGLPMFAQYGVSIKNSQTVTRTVGAHKYKSPSITLTNQNPVYNTGPIAGLLHSVELDLADPSNSATSAPAFLPSFDNFNNLHDNPSTPTFWAFPFANVNFSHTAGAQNGQPFLFDTGAQVTVISEQMAANVGFDVVNDTPDFTVEVAGVGGATTNVPGFYLQSFTIPAVGGALTLSNVPVLVLNVVDPHDGIGFVPGIVGMNLFTNRDLFLNLNPSNPYVAWGEVLDRKWNVNSNGNWTTDTNWMLGVPDAIDDQANFTDAIGIAHTVTVDQPITVGSMSFDNTAKYTIAGSQLITVESSAAGAITVANGSHDITAPMAIASDTLITVTNAADKLKLTQLQSTSKNLTKSGSGKLELNVVRAGGLMINNGTVEITANGGTNSVSKVKSLTITGATSKLDLHNNDLVVDYTGGSSPYSTIINQVKSGLTLLGGAGTTGIGSTEVDAQTLLGTVLAVVDNGAIGGEFTTLSGFTDIPANSVLVKYTWFGDSNLDGIVDGSDYALIDSGFTGGGLLTGWLFGDYNYDGNVSFQDYALIDTGYISQTSSLPEPGMLGFLAMSGLCLIRRRK